MSFEFRALPNRVEFDQPEKSVRVGISAQARRVATGRTENVYDVAAADVRVRSVLQAVGNTVHRTGSIPNTGPLPPQVGKTTSYVLKYFVKKQRKHRFGCRGAHTARPGGGADETDLGYS